MTRPSRHTRAPPEATRMTARPELSRWESFKWSGFLVVEGEQAAVGVLESSGEAAGPTRPSPTAIGPTATVAPVRDPCRRRVGIPDREMGRPHRGRRQPGPVGCEPRHRITASRGDKELVVRRAGPEPPAEHLTVEGPSHIQISGRQVHPARSALHRHMLPFTRPRRLPSPPNARRQPPSATRNPLTCNVINRQCPGLPRL